MKKNLKNLFLVGFFMSMVSISFAQISITIDSNSNLKPAGIIDLSNKTNAGKVYPLVLPLFSADIGQNNTDSKIVNTKDVSINPKMGSMYYDGTEKILKIFTGSDATNTRINQGWRSLNSRIN